MKNNAQRGFVLFLLFQTTALPALESVSHAQEAQRQNQQGSLQRDSHKKAEKVASQAQIAAYTSMGIHSAAASVCLVACIAQTVGQGGGQVCSVASISAGVLDMVATFALMNITNDSIMSLVTSFSTVVIGMAITAGISIAEDSVESVGDVLLSNNAAGCWVLFGLELLQVAMKSYSIVISTQAMEEAKEKQKMFQSYQDGLDVREVEGLKEKKSPSDVKAPEIALDPNLLNQLNTNETPEDTGPLSACQQGSDSEVLQCFGATAGVDLSPIDPVTFKRFLKKSPADFLRQLPPQGSASEFLKSGLSQVLTPEGTAQVGEAFSEFESLVHQEMDNFDASDLSPELAKQFSQLIKGRLKNKNKSHTKNLREKTKETEPSTEPSYEEMFQARHISLFDRISHRYEKLNPALGLKDIHHLEGTNKPRGLAATTQSKGSAALQNKIKAYEAAIQKDRHLASLYEKMSSAMAQLFSGSPEEIRNKTQHLLQQQMEGNTSTPPTNLSSEPLSGDDTGIQNVLEFK